MTRIAALLIALSATASAFAAPQTPALLNHIEWSECYVVDCYDSPGYPIPPYPNSTLLGSLTQRGPQPRPVTASDVCRTLLGPAHPQAINIEGNLVRVYDTGTTSGVCFDPSVVDPYPDPTDPTDPGPTDPIDIDVWYANITKLFSRNQE